jgi:hypothetical protein
MSPLTDYEERILSCVERYGCFVVSVFAGEDDAWTPPLSYSVGFTKSLGQPEVINLGLPRETGHEVINALYAQCADGLEIFDGQRIDSLFAGYPCIMRPVDESWLIQSYFASALWFHRTQMGSGLKNVFQMVWPDADGRFPWEEDCADWVKVEQPAMYEPRGVQ